MGTGATAGHDHMVKVEAHLEHLVHDFFHATHIAQGTQRRGSAAGDDVGLSAFGRQLGSHFFHGFHHVAAAGHHGDALDAQQLEQEVVAGGFGIVAAFHAFFQHQMAVHTFMDSPGKGQAAVVGLHGAAGDDRIAAFLQGIGDAEVQLTGLVAAGGTGEHVVTLDVDVDVRTQSLGEVGAVLDGGGSGDIATTGELGKIHEDLLG